MNHGKRHQAPLFNYMPHAILIELGERFIAPPIDLLEFIKLTIIRGNKNDFIQSIAHLSISIYSYLFCDKADSALPNLIRHSLYKGRGKSRGKIVSCGFALQAYWKILTLYQTIKYLIHSLWKRISIHLQKVLTQVSLRSPRRLTWVDTFCWAYWSVILHVIGPACLRIQSVIRQNGFLCIHDYVMNCLVPFITDMDKIPIYQEPN